MTTQADAKRREHITLKAVTTTTDQGVFEAVISTEGIDREKDVVSADGMVAALRKWNRPLPLAWNHRTDAADIFGTMDPASAKNVNGEVIATGQVDLTSDVGKEAWRSFKSRTIGFSFGYLILAATERKGGGRAITELDVFEITATPTPMNNETRVLGTKSTEELREEAMRVEREVQEQAIPDVPEPPEAPTEPEVDLVKELQEVKAQIAEMRDGLAALTKKADETVDAKSARSVDPLRQQADAVALEFASGDERLLHPPKTVAPKRPEPALSLKELRDRTRDELLGVLSGGIETT
jgi:HK97 family phage prohead protease